MDALLRRDKYNSKTRKCKVEVDDEEESYDKDEEREELKEKCNADAAQPCT